VPHRIVEHMSRGQVYFAGDAAHLHSPVGARGMNLGIEDARVFAGLALDDRLDEYDRMRHHIDAQVVRDVSLLSHVADAGSAVYRTVRERLLPVAINRPFVRNQMVLRLTGLDHPGPDDPPNR
jgi:2-polyprenyl-6-methoxyphenol hydroxylase-like FAD-dependent oxidoreductase